MSKNSRAARRGEVYDVDLDLDVDSEQKDGRTRVLEQLAETGVRQPDEASDDVLKPQKKSIQKQRSRARNKRTKKGQEKAEAFQDMLKEKVAEAEKRHKSIRKYREDELNENDSTAAAQ